MPRATSSEVEPSQLKGLHIPINPEIYLPVLEELDKQGIRFNEQTQEI